MEEKNSRVTCISGLLKRQITPSAGLQFHESCLFVSFLFSAADDAFKVIYQPVI